MINAVLLLGLVAIVSFVNFYQASSSPSYGIFFAVRDGSTRTDPSSDDTKNIIDDSFHRCSYEKSCSKVAENVKTNKYKIIRCGEASSFEKHDRRIWHKGMEAHLEGLGKKHFYPCLGYQLACDIFCKFSASYGSTFALFYGIE